MPVLEDLAAAVEIYPVANVVITIENLGVIAPGVATAVNVNEIWRFRVKIVNNGLLNMTNVSLHINGLNDALVSETATGPWYSTVTTRTFNLNGNGASHMTGFFNFKAPPTPKAVGTLLVGAHIKEWDANLQNILDGSSNHALIPKGTYAAQVFP